ncbi:hypothetical protein FHQ18_11440 [Deferribacter autotrophicus]|uniref:Uncharacterized protein n=1 Tax=Deferribacter autotrophicus TaxID=500465 RepID=A0A5A8F0Q5_9BACT|nr:hypothetical protein [Deferribacter autotrophicus]KAA0257173.1 hypothetical protein FHQ18_11440 [Deferribacter autotrophicus]
MNDGLKNEIGILVENVARSRTVARSVLDSYLREKQFNSSLRKEVTDYFYKCIRFYGLYKKELNFFDSYDTEEILEKQENCRKKNWWKYFLLMLMLQR